MKKFLKLTSILASAALGATLFAGCTFGDAGQDSTADSEGLTYVSLRINPEIEFVADENGNVVSASAINSDGEVVLSDLSLEGESVEEASEDFTDKATELGFLDADSTDATVYTNVEGDNAENIKKSIAERLNKFFDNNGIYGKVSEETLSEYADKVDSWGISAGHVKMVLRVLDLYPDMTEEEILALPVNELIALIKDNCKEHINAELRDEYKQKVAEIKTKYADMFALKEEINTIKDKLEGYGDNEEEIASLQKEIAEKQAAYDTRKTSYDAELAAVKADTVQKTADINIKYADMFTLASEIDNLKAQLENTELTDEQKTELQASINEKQTAYDTEKAAYDTEIATVADGEKQITEALDINYADMFDLKEEINALDNKLAGAQMTEEEKDALEAEKDEKEQAYEILKDAYKNELETLKEEYKQKSEDIKEEQKQKCEDKKNKNSEKNKEHGDKFNANKDKIKDKIKEWRKGQNCISASDDSESD